MFMEKIWMTKQGKKNILSGYLISSQKKFPV